MSETVVCCAAPAKINLFLHVVGRRADGYHLLQSVFRLLDWSDTLQLRVRSDGEIRRLSDVSGVPPETDLIVRAARMLQRETGCRQGAELMLEKRLPMGGGLGGGSSDAASTLIALNRLWGLGLRRAELIRLGLALGADVPFFLFGQDAFVEGVGERLQTIELPAARYVVLSPQVQVPTAAIFSAPQLTRNSPPIKMPDFAASTTRNDLEPVARALYPEVGRAIDWLGQYAPARMTGSGCCVFARFENEREASRVVDECPRGWCAWSVRTLPAHPMRDWVRD